MIGRAGLRFGLALGQLRLGQLYVKSPDDGVDFDGIPILQQGDRSANGGFRPDLANAEPARCSREPAVGHQCALSAHAPPPPPRRGPQHLAPTATAARPLTADTYAFSRLLWPVSDHST